MPNDSAPEPQRSNLVSMTDAERDRLDQLLDTHDTKDKCGGGGPRVFTHDCVVQVASDLLALTAPRIAAQAAANYERALDHIHRYLVELEKSLGQTSHRVVTEHTRIQAQWLHRAIEACKYEKQPEFDAKFGEVLP